MIETERLRVRSVVETDVDSIFALFSDPRVARWSGDGQAMTSRDEAVARVERYATRGGAQSWAGVFVIETPADEFAGITMLVPLPASAGFDRDDFEIGWHLLPSMWGHGYATESAAAMAARGFDAGLTEVFAVTAPDNGPSQAVCARLAMTDLGLRDDWYDARLRAFRLTRQGRVSATS